MPHFTCNFLSYTLHRAMDIDVIIPGVTSTEADSPGPTHRPAAKYPVLYLLHGYCNDYSTWERYTSIERYAEERRIAVVTFSAENHFYVKTSDWEGQFKYLDDMDYACLLEKEIPEFVTSMFPVSDKPEDTYIAGLSMGGYGAMNYAFRNPGKYRAVGAFSPLPSRCKEVWQEKGTVPEELKKYDPLYMLEENRAKGIKSPDLYYSYGGKDFLKDKQDWFKEELGVRQLPHTFDYMEEFGHEWAFWDIQVRLFLDWIPRTDTYYMDKPLRQI